jgi:hypothetical protein
MRVIRWLEVSNDPDTDNSSHTPPRSFENRPTCSGDGACSLLFNVPEIERFTLHLTSAGLSRGSGMRWRASQRLPNHPNFAQPGVWPGSATHGVIGATRIASREGQLALKFAF